MPHDIVIVGSTNVDFVMKLSRLPGIGDCVSDGTFVQTFGGKGANTALAAAKTSARPGSAAFITALGEDTHAEHLLTGFKSAGLDTSGIKRCRGVPTGSALIMLDAQGRNYLAVAPGANDQLLPADIPACRALIRGAGIVVMQLEIPVPTILAVLTECQAASVPVLFNYAPVRSTDIRVSPAMAVLVVNEAEAAQLSGVPVASVESALLAARTLRSRGAGLVVVTLGPEGAVAIDADAEHVIPACKVDPVDTTAAGDTFCGSLAVALAERRPLPEALRFASAAAALACTKLGAQPSIPTRAEVDAFQRERLAIAAR
jgi:ribokinase